MKGIVWLLAGMAAVFLVMYAVVILVALLT